MEGQKISQTVNIKYLLGQFALARLSRGVDPFTKQHIMRGLVDRLKEAGLKTPKYSKEYTYSNMFNIFYTDQPDQNVYDELEKWIVEEDLNKASIFSKKPEVVEEQE